MCGMSPDSSRSPAISYRDGGHASAQLKKGGWPPWWDTGLGICRGGCKEEHVKPPSSAELWWLRGAPKPCFHYELALVSWRNPCPSHTWSNFLPGGHAVPWVHQQASSTPMPFPRAQFWHHSGPWLCFCPALSALSWLMDSPLRAGVGLRSFKLFFKFIFAPEPPPCIAMGCFSNLLSVVLALRDMTN